MKNALSSNKGVLIYLHRTGCSYCNSMGEFTLDDDLVKKFIQKNYLFIHINITESDKITYKNKVTNGLTFAKNIGYNFYPTVLFLDTDAKVKYAVVGYKEEDEFLALLKYVHSGSFKKMTFENYKKKISFKKRVED
jgi:thioredoxin-related protein